MQIEKLAEENAVVGEGPLWNPEEQQLLWSDIHQGKLFSFDPATGKNTLVHQGVNVGGFVQNRQGGYALCIWDGILLWRSDEDWVRLVPETHDGEALHFNDVIADPGGRIFAGSYFGEKPGKLYRFDPDGRISVVAEGIGCSNGMGFSPDHKTMYYTDAAARIIYAYDYQKGTGQIANQRVFAKISDRDGVPDGMTVDAQGFVWSANWFGSCIIRLDPDGKEERRIQTPAKQTSSVMFGGKDLDELYFTSADYKCEPGSSLDPAGYDWDGYNRSYRGGGLFRIRGLGIQGKEEFKADFAWPAKK